MRALFVIGAAAVLAACTPGGPRAHTAFDWAQCENGTESYTRIAACSQVAGDYDADPQRRAAALVQRGMLRAEFGQPARAVADFGRALRLDPASADALVERGLVHHERGAYEIAVRDFDAALAIDPNIPLALERRDAALSGRRLAYAQQLEQLNEALARDPTDSNLLNSRCWLRATNNDNLDAALADCNAALIGNPRSGEALDSRGFVRMKRGEFELALADYEAALALEPQSGHYLYGRGLARRGLGRTEEAEADFVEAERHEPGIAAQYRTYGISL